MPNEYGELDFIVDLGKILTSAYGEDVTKSIHDAIQYAAQGGDFVLNDDHLSEENNISQNPAFFKTGMWHAVYGRGSSSNVEERPIGWPTNPNGTLAGTGRLVVFGWNGDSAITNTNVVQMVFERNNNRVWWRIGQGKENDAYTWGGWYPVSSFEARRQLTSSDNLDNEEFCHSGLWTAYVSDPNANPPREDRPQNWPEVAPGVKAPTGRLIVFGNESNPRSTAPMGRIQMVITRNYHQIWWRIGRESSNAAEGGSSGPLAGWGNWAPINSSGVYGTYVALGASTTKGQTSGDGTSSHPYPFYVGAMGGLGVRNLAVGDTGVILRHDGTDNDQPDYDAAENKNNYMDIITDPSNAAFFAAADLITLNIGVNDYTLVAPGTATDARTVYQGLIGSINDYLPYDRNMTYAQLKTYTVLGAWNFIIKYLAEQFPKAQLMGVRLPSLPPKRPKLENNQVTFQNRDSQYYLDILLSYGADHSSDRYKAAWTDYKRAVYNEEFVPLITELLGNLNVPIANPNPTWLNGWTNYRELEVPSLITRTSEHKDSDKYYAYPHPRKLAYENYSRATAAAILAKFHN